MPEPADIRDRIIELADQVRAEEEQVNAGELQAFASYGRKQQATARLLGIDIPPDEDEPEAA